MPTQGVDDLVASSEQSQARQDVDRSRQASLLEACQGQRPEADELPLCYVDDASDGKDEDQRQREKGIDRGVRDAVLQQEDADVERHPAAPAQRTVWKRPSLTMIITGASAALPL